jgi:hypothetical protein
LLASRMKVCTKCKKEKERFPRQSGKADGLHSWCVECKGEYGRLWRQLNPKPRKQRPRIPECERKSRKSASFRLWYQKNKSYYQERKNNPSVKIAVYYRTRVCNAIRRSVKKGSKSAPTAALIGCSIDFLRNHLESRFRDGMTWGNYGPFWHVDHIKPIADFDLSDPEQQIACFHYTNLQPLLKEENLRKNKYAYQSTLKEAPPAR